MSPTILTPPTIPLDESTPPSGSVTLTPSSPDLDKSIPGTPTATATPPSTPTYPGAGLSRPPLLRRVRAFDNLHLEFQVALLHEALRKTDRFFKDEDQSPELEAATTSTADVVKDNENKENEAQTSEEEQPKEAEAEQQQTVVINVPTASVEA